MQQTGSSWFDFCPAPAKITGTYLRCVNAYDERRCAVYADVLPTVGSSNQQTRWSIHKSFLFVRNQNRTYAVKLSFSKRSHFIVRQSASRLLILLMEGERMQLPRCLSHASSVIVQSI